MEIMYYHISYFGKCGWRYRVIIIATKLFVENKKQYFKKINMIWSAQKNVKGRLIGR